LVIFILAYSPQLSLIHNRGDEIKMESCLVKNKDKLEFIDDNLLESISNFTDLSKTDIRNLDIEDIEKHIGVNPKPSKVFFNWENAEKEGWQNLKFVDENEFIKREKRMDKELRQL